MPPAGRVNDPDMQITVMSQHLANLQIADATASDLAASRESARVCAIRNICTKVDGILPILFIQIGNKAHISSIVLVFIANFSYRYICVTFLQSGVAIWTDLEL